MKNKRALAIIISIMMMTSLTYVPSFAASSNNVDTAVSVSEDQGLPATAVNFTVKSGGSWHTDQTISLTITNAEFTSLPTSINADGQVVAGSTAVITTSYYDRDATDGAAKAVKITDIQSIYDDSIQLTVSTYEDETFTTMATPATDDMITINFPVNALTATGSSGKTVTVAVDGMESDITSGTYTIARIVTGGTTTTLKGKVKTYSNGKSFNAAEIQIKEKTVNSISQDSVHVLKFTLPKNVAFSTVDGDPYISQITGNLFATTSLTSAVSTETSFATMADNPGSYYLDKDNRVLVASIKMNGAYNSTESSILTFGVKIGREAATGSITISGTDVYTTAGNSIDSFSNIKIATYGTESITVSSSSTIPTVVAGQIKDLDDQFFWTEIKLTESMYGSFTDGSEIDVDFPEGVQIVTRYIDGDAGVRASFDGSRPLDKASTSKNIDVDGLTAASDVSCVVDAKTIYLSVDYDDGPTLANDTSGFSVQVPKANMSANKTWEAEKANTLVLFIPVTVSADFTGDIVATVDGKDFERKELTVGKVVSPLTFTTTVTDVVNDAQQQKVANLVITENVAGYVGRNEEASEIRIKLDSKGLVNGYAFKNATVGVTSGNIEIRKNVAYNEDGSISFFIDDESTVVSTITISDIVINTARQLAEGQYAVGVLVNNAYSGCAEIGKVSKTDTLSDPDKDAVIQNAQFNDGAFGVEKELLLNSTPYINILTGADTSQGGTLATFFLDATNATTYTVNSVTYEMDAAAYIDSNNRTMVPIRYVAYALGLTDSDISYDADSFTATISGMTNVVRVTTGSNVLRCSVGSNITMDTVAVNYAGRLYVPARFITQSLGAEVSWDQETQTVIITQ